MTPTRAFLCLAAIGVLAASAAAQEDPTPSPCRAATCVLVFDWGGDALPPAGDRVFGSGHDFETAFRGRLSDVGYRIAAAGARGAFQVTIRVKMASALCNPNPGLNPDRSCRTASTASLAVSGLDSNMAPMKAIQVAPRCPDPYAAMKMTQFALYAADILVLTLDGPRSGVTRPAIKCLT